MNTSKTKALKLFRMNTYKKTGEGVSVAQALLPVFFLNFPAAIANTVGQTSVCPQRLRRAGASTSVRSKSPCVSRRRISLLRFPSISTSLGRVLAL